MQEMNERYGKADSVVVFGNIARLVVSGVKDLRVRIVANGQKTYQACVRIWGNQDHIGSVILRQEGSSLYVESGCGGLVGGDIRIGNVTGQVCIGSNIRQTSSVVISNCHQSVTVTGNSSVSGVRQSVRMGGSHVSNITQSIGCAQARSEKYDEDADGLPPVIEIEVPAAISVKLEDIARPFEVGDLRGKLSITTAVDAIIGNVDQLYLDTEEKAEVSVASVSGKLRSCMSDGSGVVISGGQVPKADISTFDKSQFWYGGIVERAEVGAYDETSITLGKVIGELRKKQVDPGASVKILY